VATPKHKKILVRFRIASKLVYLRKACNIVKESSIKKILSQNGFMYADKGFTDASMVNVGNEINAILQQVHIRTLKEFKII
jgi:hypothetical protein